MRSSYSVQELRCYVGLGAIEVTLNVVVAVSLVLQDDARPGLNAPLIRANHTGVRLYSAHILSAILSSPNSTE